MSDQGSIPRDLLDKITPDHRSKRWLERLHQQAMVLTPDEVLVLQQRVEDAELLADDAFTLAYKLRHIATDELLPLEYPHVEKECELPFNPAPSVPDHEGWALYQDTAYTITSPFTVIEGTKATLPNNSGSVLRDDLPLNANDFYSAALQKITPVAVGDYGIITIRFYARCSRSGGRAVLTIDLGGAIGERFPHLLIFPVGAGAWHPFDIPIPCYMLDTFFANGGTIKIEAQVGDASIYDISYQITRIYAR